MTSNSLVSKPQRGFTLLELLVSLALFSLGVVSLFVVKSNSVREAYMSRNLTLARMLGESLMEDLVLGTRDYEDGEGGDVWSLEGIEFEAFQTDDYEGFYWTVGVEEVVLVGETDDIDFDENYDAGYAEQRNQAKAKADPFGNPNSGYTPTGKPTSRRAEPKDNGGKKNGGGGGGLFGGGGGSDGEEEQAEPVFALKLRVTINFLIANQEEYLELETLASFVMDDLFEGVDDGSAEDGEPGLSNQGKQGASGKDNNRNQNRGDPNEAGRALFGDG